MSQCNLYIAVSRYNFIQVEIPIAKKFRFNEAVLLTPKKPY